jgi:hypothetical protein
LSHRKAINFGPLPTASINQALNLELDTADVVLSSRAEDHAQRRHPNDFETCRPHLQAVIANPLYVRDDFKNDGKIELVGRPTAMEHWLLIAISIIVSSDGHYHILSFYPISQKKVDTRRNAGHLKRIIPEEKKAP